MKIQQIKTESRIVDQAWLYGIRLESMLGYIGKSANANICPQVTVTWGWILQTEELKLTVNSAKEILAVND
jgi:hypothetical protein